MQLIRDILTNQKEVKHLCFFVQQDERTGQIKMNLSTCTINKNLVFSDENACLNKLVELLLELKGLEKWALNKINRESK
jgi:hypothetical protein